MALKNNNQEELPYPIEGIEEEHAVEQVSFDDVEFEAEVLSDEELAEELESKVYYTISGKEQQYEPEWEVYNIKDFDVGEILEGRPEITIFENDDKSYNSLRLRIMDDGEIVNLYLNFPKKEWPYVTNINSGFDFYRTCFDFIFSILKLRDERNVTKNGKPVNKFKKVNLEMLAKYVDQHARVGVKITDGNSDSDYNSWIVCNLE